jgi:hypothetical protein
MKSSFDKYPENPDIYDASPWLWSALVARMVDDGLTVEAMRRLVEAIPANGLGKHKTLI